MTEAILTFSTNSYLSRNLKHGERMTVHGALQFGAGACFLIAFISIYNVKINANRSHFMTTHSIFGLITLILVAGTAMGGLLARYTFIVSRIIRPVYMKIIHSTFGIITYLLAMVTVCLGLDSGWARHHLNEVLILCMISFVALSAVLVVIQPTVKNVKRLKDRM